jgi:hypothetical protein
LTAGAAASNINSAMEAWVPSDNDPVSVESSTGDKPEQWLPRESGKSPDGLRPAKPGPRRRRKLRRRGTPTERWLLSRLRRKQRRLDEQRHEIALLRRRLSELEDAVKGDPPAVA